MLSLTTLTFFPLMSSKDFFCCSLWPLSHSSSVHLWETLALSSLQLLSRYSKTVIRSSLNLFSSAWRNPAHSASLCKIDICSVPLNILVGVRWTVSCLLIFLFHWGGEIKNRMQCWIYSLTTVLLLFLLVQPNVFLAFFARARCWLAFSSTNRFNLTGLHTRESIGQLQS